MVLRRIEALGVKVHTNVNVKDMLIEKDEDGGDVFKGFEFDDGEVVGSFRSLLVSSSPALRVATRFVSLPRPSLSPLSSFLSMHSQRLIW